MIYSVESETVHAERLVEVVVCCDCMRQLGVKDSQAVRIKSSV